MSSDTSHKRHIAKAITRRIIGTLDTMALAWLISGNPLTGVKVGVAEVLTKMILYYLHERVWYLCDLGLPERRLRYQDKNVKKRE